MEILAVSSKEPIFLCFSWLFYDTDKQTDGICADYQG
jgi:hypothetical protein